MLERWNSCTIPPILAQLTKVCVTVFERRSHLGPPAEGRQGPSDDDDDDIYIMVKCVCVCVSVTKVIISVFKGFGRFSCF